MLILCYAALFSVILTVIHGKEDSVAFTATVLRSDASSSRTIIKFARVQFNNGNSYSTTTGKFTCTIPGVYHFAVVLSRRSSVFGNVHAYLTINDHHKLTLFGQIKGAYPLSAAGAFHLNRNDEVYVEGFPSAFLGGTYSSFTGHLIAAD